MEQKSLQINPEGIKKAHTHWLWVASKCRRHVFTNKVKIA